MDETNYLELTLLNEHVITSPKLINISVLCLNADELYIYKPSLYSYDNCSILDKLGISCDTDHLDMVDSSLLSGIISYIFTYGSYETVLYSYVNELISMIATRTRVIDDIELDSSVEYVLTQYVEIIRSHIMAIVAKHVVGYESVQYKHCYEDLIRADKYYVLDNAHVYFNRLAYDISIHLKRYTTFENKRINR